MLQIVQTYENIKYKFMTVNKKVKIVEVNFSKKEKLEFTNYSNIESEMKPSYKVKSFTF